MTCDNCGKECSEQIQVTSHPEWRDGNWFFEVKP